MRPSRNQEVPVQAILETLETGLGLEIVQWFHRGGPGFLWYLLLPFHYIGDELGVMVVLAAVYWCVDKRQGIRLMVLVLGAQVFSNVFKVWWDRPRPFHVAPERIQPISDYTQPGLPSGHTIFGTTSGLWLGQNWRATAGYTVAGLLILLMGISRMVHGVHYPQDVVMGWLIGGILFLVFVWIESRTRSWFQSAGAVRIAVLILGVSVVVLAAALLLDPEFENRKSILAPAGAIAGGALGLVIDRELLGFQTAGNVRRRLLRLLVGLLLLAPVHIALSAAFYAIFGEHGGFWAAVFYMDRYGLMGLWVALGIPLVFTRLGLAEARAT